MTYPIFEGDKTASPVIAPRRPTLDDFGGREFEQALKYLPNDRRRIPLHGYMQTAMAVDRVCRLIPLLSVDFQCAAYPSPGTILYVNSVVDALTTTTVTISRYASGRYTIAWPSGSLPSLTQKAKGKPLGTPLSLACRAYQTGNQCLVWCYTETGDFADSTSYNFNVTFWGE